MRLSDCYVVFEEVEILYGIDDYVSFKRDGRRSKCLIRYASDRSYFKHKGQRYYFDELMKC